MFNEATPLIMRRDTAVSRYPPLEVIFLEGFYILCHSRTMLQSFKNTRQDGSCRVFLNGARKQRLLH
jgi:hypothetical protein